MDSRKILQNDTSVFLVRQGHTKPEEFLITRCNGAGSSCICYTAVLKENGRDVEGTLKEYYPLDAGVREFAFDLARKKSEYPELRNQLYSKPSTIDNLRHGRDDYIFAYNELEKARNDYKDLNQFIPSAVIYKSFTGNGEIVDAETEDCEENYTVYTWVRNDPQMYPYEKLLEKIRSDTIAEVDAEKNVSLILNCILELAKGISQLHMAGLYHLDLTPNNFGVKTYKNTADENISISLYDTNSVYSIDRNYYPSAGTKYFRSSEVKTGTSELYGIQSDIYSIGAILYYSLVMESDNEGKCKSKYYEGENFGIDAFYGIAAELKSSALMQLSDATENAILHRMLISVLQKALNRYDDPVGNYMTMDDLADDLSEIIGKFSFFVSKKSFAETGKYLLETNLKTKEDHWNEQIKTGAAGAIMHHLYKYPLYDYVPKGEECLNILVIGGGTYASKFTDLAFELSQIRNCYTSITVGSMDRKNDKEAYLSVRPEFKNYFELDGEKPARTKEAPYGSLTYKAIEEINKESDISLIYDIMAEKQYSYVFIAVNDEKINEYTAEMIYEKLPDETKAMVCYVAYSGKKRTESSGCKMMMPVKVNETLEKSSDYKELRRMAFNVHLTWSPDGITDIKKAEGSFAQKYNFYSSLENAISIKYKLHSIGIDIDSGDLRQKAKEVRTFFDNNKDIVQKLVMYEHRRWNVGLIISSWRTLEAEAFTSLTSSTKLKKKKLHPCLVPSKEEVTLSQQKWCEKNFAFWDTAKMKDLEQLDALDLMSVRLHRHFVRLAKELKENRIVLNTKIALLRSLILEDSELVNYFELYCHAVNNLFDDGANRESVRIYKYHLNAYERAVKQKEGAILHKKDADDLINDIKDLLFPLIEAKSYTDWKSKDYDLIYNIPFILSYSAATHLCVPMVLSAKKINTDSLFANVAAALVLNPSLVTYIVDGDIVKKSFNSFVETLNYISNIFKKHRLQTKIKITVFERIGTDYSIDTQELKKSFSVINYIEEIEYGGPDAINVMREYLNNVRNERIESRRFTAIEYNETKISGVLQGANYVGKTLCTDNSVITDEKISYSTLFPFYTYDSRLQKFETSYDCRYLSYVTNRSYLNVDDLFYAKGKQSNAYEPELQTDYMFFWKLYRSRPEAWKELCAKLKKDCEVQLASIDSNALTEEMVSHVEFIVPDFCENTLNLVLNEIRQSQIGILSVYSLVYRTSRSLTLTLSDVSKTVVRFFSNLLADPLMLADSSLINIVRHPSGFKVNSYRMKVSNFLLSSCKDRKTVESFLRQMEDAHYISSLSVITEPQKDTLIARFSFSSIHILRLMINEGNLFETYVYYKMLESGQFDDVKNSVVISWNESGASNELDIVATKGFRTVIIECKAKKELEPEFYNKLYPTGDVFGVNNSLVVLADINDGLNAGNAMQKARGEELGITTIWETSTFLSEIKKIMQE